MTVTDMQAVVADVTYKPGWSIQVYEGRHHGPHIQITCALPDAYNPDQTTTLDVHSSIPPQADRGAFLSWLLWRITAIEVHECREFLRYRGTVPFDPHAEYSDRDL